jgi:hypothetical protein
MKVLVRGGSSRRIRWISLSLSACLLCITPRLERPQVGVGGGFYNHGNRDRLGSILYPWGGYVCLGATKHVHGSRLSTLILLAGVNTPYPVRNSVGLRGRER